MFRYLFQDFKVRGISNGKALFYQLTDRGSSAVFLYRLSSWCYQHNLKLLAVLFKQANIIVNSCEINFETEIGSGFRVYHAIGIVLDATTIGSNFSIYQNVTIGRNGTKNHRSTPIIGDNVTLYTGSVVAGALTIGNNVKVGANSVLLKDAPANSTVIGTPVTIID